MTQNLRFGAFTLSLVLAFIHPRCVAQQPAQAQPGQPQPEGQPIQPPQAAPQSSAVQAQQKPPQEPYILEDGGLSIEPIYWFNKAQPVLTEVHP